MRRLRFVFVCLMLLFPRPIQAQYVYLDYDVTEEDFAGLLGSLKIEDERLDDVRALWGRLHFDLTHGIEAAVAFEQWDRACDDEFGCIGVHYTVRPDPPVWDWERHNAFFRVEQRTLTARFFDDLVELVPMEASSIESLQRAVRRRASWRIRLIYIPGTKCDLYEVLATLQRRHPDLPFAPIQWTSEVRDLLDEYELALDVLLIEFDRLYLIREDRANRQRLPESDEDRRAWVDWFTHFSCSPYGIMLPIRELQTMTTVLLAEALPEEAFEPFLDEALARISPFAWRTLNWEFWMRQALARRDLDDDSRAALEELQHIQKREKRTNAKRLVELFETQFDLEEMEAATRRSSERYAKLRDDEEEDPPASEAAYKQAIEAYAAYDRQSVARIRRVLGDQANSIEGAVISRIKTQKEEIRWEKFTLANRLGNEAYEETARPRQRSPFITESEFVNCLDEIVFEDDLRRSVFESIYQDFVDRFMATRVEFDQRKFIALDTKWGEVNVAKPVDPPDDQHDWYQEWRDIRRRLENEFADQVREQLKEAEKALWTREVRRLRRFRVIPYMRNMVRVRPEVFCHDLFEVFDAVGLRESADDDLLELLGVFEEEIDKALIEFNDRDRAMGKAFMALNEEARSDPTKLANRKRDKARKDWMAVREMIITLRFQYVPLIAEALDETRRAAFLDTLNRAEFPWLYDESMADRVIAALHRDRILDAEGSELLDALKLKYERDRETHRRDYLALIPHYLTETDQERRQRMQSLVYDTAARRIKLDRDTCAEIRALIDDQFDDLAFDIRLLLSSYN